MSLSARNSIRRCCLVVAISLGLVATLPALAQQPTARYELNLPGQPLDNALIALGKATHLNIAFEPASVAGLSAPVLIGNYTAEEALDRLLEGSGLSARRTQGGSYAVEPASAKNKHQGTQPARTNDQTNGKKITGDGAQTLDTVVVTAQVQGFSATRMPTALKDIPQSVTVIDQQTLREQNANDLSTAFNWATGITLQRQGSDGNWFLSRGFSIDTVHIDGGAPLGGLRGNGVGRVDLSQYERIELLRGADALFGGGGDPGGSINLIRKRPLPEASTSLAVSAGSWDNYRTEADVNTGGITDSGRLRGRLLLVSDSQHYFYNTAKRRMNKLYAVTEYDLAPKTRLTLGGSFERTPTNVVDDLGLPRYEDGADAHLPRSTSLTFPWVKRSSTSKEGFLQLEHSFAERWKFKAGLTRNNSDGQVTGLFSGTPINPVTRTLTIDAASTGESTSPKTSIDTSLAGSFDWHGREQEVMFGFDYMRSDFTSSGSMFLWPGPPIDPFHFDPSKYPSPFSGPAVFKLSSNAASWSRGVFASIKLRPMDRLAVTVGARNNSTGGRDTVNQSMGSLVLPPRFSSISASGIVTPYFGVVYEISPQYSLYGSYADTFSSGATGIRRTVSGKMLGVPFGTNMELGVKAAWNDGRLNGSLALFNIKQDGFDTDRHAPPQLVNPGNCCYLATTSRSKGFETELSGQITRNWHWGSGYTFNVNRAGDGHALSSVTPKHLLKLWTSYALSGRAQGWSIGGGVIAQSSHYQGASACLRFDLVSGDCIGGYMLYRAIQGGYAVATMRIGYRMNDRWDLALNIDNLADRRYYQTVGGTIQGNWYGAPRNWMLTLRGEL